jgi:hypothetical protein
MTATECATGSRPARQSRILRLQSFRLAAYHKAGYQDHERPGQHDEWMTILIASFLVLFSSMRTMKIGS